MLEIKNLSVDFSTMDGPVHAVKNVSLSIKKGEVLALVGESGSGKSCLALSILQLLPYPSASHPSGSIQFNGKEMVSASERDLRQIRGNRIAMIFQEPSTALNPLHTVYKQISEVIELHANISRAEVEARVKTLLDEVGLSHLKDRLDAFPHQLSGGERQRVMIAMAIANEPDLLIADEPTTALDVTIQAQVLRLLKSLQKSRGLAVLFITHDLTIVRKVADRIAVMQHGEIVETNDVASLFAKPKHPYTQKLLASEPAGNPIDTPKNAPTALSCENLMVKYPSNQPLFPWNQKYNVAVQGISLSLPQGSTLGVVGESGSGKSTLGFALLRLIKSEGVISFNGERIDTRNTESMRPLRGQLQIVFQDPYSSLNPRMTVEQILGEGLKVHKKNLPEAKRDEQIDEMLQEVGLTPADKHRYPHEFSGGQRQRISIARAIILNPKLVVLDEPTSALDLSVQAQILDLLKSLQKKLGMSYIFISHDLRVVKAISHHVIVMQKGKIVEEGNSAELFKNPQQDYTKALLTAAFSTKL